MHYADSEQCPRTFEDYCARVLQDGELPLDAAKRILREHNIVGRSKMRAWEIRRGAEELDPVASLQARSDGAKLYRWIVAHGLELSYAELAELESMVGVKVVSDGTSRGTYSSYEDVKKVYAIGAAHTEQTVSTSIRLPYDTERDKIAADEIIKTLDDVFVIDSICKYQGRYGGRLISADVLMPLPLR